MSAVEFAGVTLDFAGRTVLEDVSLAIAPGEFIGVFGPNGAGKTTLLRSILGLVAPQTGSIRVFDHPATRGNRRIGYMPQSRTTIASLRILGADFVACAADGARWGLPWPGPDARRDVAWALDMVGATALARRPLADLSGGERQRVLLAQALLGQPGLLLLDEPLMSLDPHHQHAVVGLVQRLRRELGVTVLFSAHELNPLLPAMDRVLYLGRGQAAIGSVEAVATGPVLSRLYGTDIEVVRIGTRIFVMAGEHDAERDTHRHEEARSRVRL